MPRLTFRAATSTPGTRGAERWLSDNPFDDDYWNDVQSHPQYQPNIDRSEFQTVPGVTGYQGDDTFHHVPEDNEEHSPSGHSYQPTLRNTSRRDQTICHDCASYMANGEGDPEHEGRFEQGAHSLAARGINLNNLAFNDTDEEGNHIRPSGDSCFICGQDVDPDAESFHSPYGSPGSRMHLFQPGDPGYHDFGRVSRVVGAVSRASDTIWR